MKQLREKRFGIRGKILVAMLAVALVPLVVSGIVSQVIARNHLRTQAEAHLSDMAMDCGIEVSHFMARCYEDLHVISHAPVFLSSDTAAKQLYLDEISEARSDWAAISVMDTDGTIIASTAQELIGDSRAGREWFEETMRSGHGDIAVQETYKAETAGREPVVGFNTPIVDENDGDVLGVIGLRVDMAYVAGVVRALDDRTRGDNHVYLMDSEATILGGPSHVEVLSRYRLYGHDVVQDLIAGNSGITRYTNDRGEDVLGVRYVLKGEGAFDGWGWGILANKPVSITFGIADEMRNKQILFTLAIVILVAIFAYAYARLFSRPVRKLSELAVRISQGDLRSTGLAGAGTTDEIGELARSLDRSTTGLRGMVKRTRDAAIQITSAAHEILAGSERQAAGVAQEASQASQTAAAAKELAASSKQVCDCSSEIAKSTISISDATDSGAEAAARVTVGMEAIRNSVLETSNRMQSLEEKSQAITEMVTLIEDIPDQTNLLSLNAAIEAARAGEAGKGFAVVAEAIGRLADRTTKSTAEISSLIKAIRHETSSCVMSMEESTSETEKGAVLAEAAGMKLGEIAGAFKGIAESAKEISLASRQQMVGSEQISVAVSGIEEVARESASTAKQSAGLAKDLSELADDLTDSMAVFKLADDLEGTASDTHFPGNPA
ncbi:methyl-accepting chemotaxis protein [bacterium]|nr:methyl-accepting chemotaxis protein [bacterium]